MKKWEFDVQDLHGLKSCEVVISDRLKWQVKNSIELTNLVNMAWGIYVRNAPLFMTVPVPNGFGIIEVTFHHEGGKIFIS